MLMLQTLHFIRKYLGIVFILYGSLYAISQENNRFIIPDSLANKDYKYLLKKSSENYSDTITSQFYLNAYLAKATIDENKIEKSKALSFLAYYAKDKKETFDILEKSLIEIEGIEDIKTIPIYNHIGAVYDSYFEYETALKHYVRALHISQKNKNKYFEYAIYNNIARIKGSIGKHHEALELYKKSLIYNETIKSRETIINNLNLAASYRHIKKHDSASYYYHKIIDANLFKINDDLDIFLKNVFTINEGINLYYKKEYKEAETLLNKGTSELTFNTDSQEYYILAQLYLGKIYEEYYQNEEKAKEYYTNIDFLLSTVDVVIPETREAYEFLIDYYKKEKDYKKQLIVTDKLLLLITITSSRKVKTSDQLHTKFDTPQLLKSKENLIKRLEHKTNTLEGKATAFKKNITYLIICITLLLALIFFQYYRHKKYKKRFEAIITELDAKQIKTKFEKVISTPQKLSIDRAIVLATLERLKLFEVNKEFLQPDINISIVAKKCETNTKYLSKIINTHKGKTFINYINDLRVDHTLKELKENAILRRYTIKSISKEVGFNTADSFTKAFKKRTGITPSYFLKNLKTI